MFSVSKTLFPVLRVVTLITFWSFKTDESVLNNCEKDWFFGTAGRFSFFYLARSRSYCFRLNFATLKLLFRHYETFTKEQISRQKNQFIFKLFFDVTSCGKSYSPVGFQSFSFMDTRSGIFRHFKFDKIFTIMSFRIFKRLGVFELWARRLAWGSCRLFNQFE